MHGRVLLASAFVACSVASAIAQTPADSNRPAAELYKTDLSALSHGRRQRRDSNP